ncbi:universal stress protein [Halarchaeum salinum]|uniref:Universal stress protein n=1 Tax=Halarchaeum salinum TaxID=489912 RepID=A0AAV3SBX3_9EURY
MVIVAAISDLSMLENVVAQADDLAQAYDDKLHVIHVIEESEYTKMAEKGAGTRTEGGGMLEEQVASEVTEGIEEVVSVEYDIVGLVGDVGEKIVDYADENDARYIVMGGRKRSPVGKALFGSVTQFVLLGTERPVVTVDTNES